jgi:hypothetical protein
VRTPKFKVEFLEEASEFLDSLEEKARYKIIWYLFSRSLPREIIFGLGSF